ncbi:UDP-N-acetylglucosamine 2-epimerase (non-hydrolyzing) [Sulfurihydrogenibium sp.]|uniref:non-hydrolyzing UDP-N-acetylglucosamine 2-epimerase n=1 Tax=Sulfurihydrogenibium sp. TaxID=2053621 RepID=UPI00261F138D|nr:UDP-N-acetylglucosamine 2-epimerase (non-hydrolyzing) [Sulfurihydrogenibium sp.]
MKILTVLGARPQFIKAAVVSREIKKHPDIKEIIIHTGQHYDINMSDIFFEQMQIPKPDYYLGINGKSHGAMTGQMMEKIEEVAIKENPDWILVYGDTNSTLAGALVASKLHIKLAHVEAGLRSFNMKMPEEINRILTDRVSNLLFCPTDTAVENLKKEGFDNFPYAKIVKVGDVMYDAYLYYRQFAKKPENVKVEKDFALCTIHRAENTDNTDRLKNILEALKEIAEDLQVILPLHPRTKKIIESKNINVDNIAIIEPVGYFEMLWLLENCRFVLTDSGGLQKEAFFAKKPCITLREETEWVELVNVGVNKLVGADKEKIVSIAKGIDEYFNDFNSVVSDLYGDGKSGEKIVECLVR